MPPYNSDMRRLLAVTVLLSACSRGPRVPVNTLLWRVESWTQTAANVRRAPAKMIIFRANGEYVEHLCYVIEQPDTSVYISASDPRVITIGNWIEHRPQIVATRRVIARPLPYRGATDPLCSDSTYTISGNSVMGKDGQYSPITRLVAPDFESYIKDAQQNGKPCPPPPPP